MQVQRIFQNYTTEDQNLNVQRLMHPLLPALKKKPKINDVKKNTGLDKSILEEITNEGKTRYHL